MVSDTLLSPFDQLFVSDCLASLKLLLYILTQVLLGLHFTLT